MLQIKLFNCGPELEDEMNAWLATHDVKVFQIQWNMTGNVMILYEYKKAVPEGKNLYSVEDNKHGQN